MPRVRGCRQHNLFSTTALFLVFLSLEAVGTHARSSSSERRNDLTSGTIERILSDQQIDDSDAIKLIAFDNLIWPTFDTFIWPTLRP